MTDREYELCQTIADLLDMIARLKEGNVSDAGRKIMEGLRDAANGNISRVHIDGQTWVRHDAGSPEDMLSQSRLRIAELEQREDQLVSMLKQAGYSNEQIAARTPYVELMSG